jgi:hypothetical protein
VAVKPDYRWIWVRWSRLFNQHAGLPELSETTLGEVYDNSIFSHLTDFQLEKLTDGLRDTVITLALSKILVRPDGGMVDTLV